MRHAAQRTIAGFLTRPLLPLTVTAAASKTTTLLLRLLQPLTLTLSPPLAPTLTSASTSSKRMMASQATAATSTSTSRTYNDAIDALNSLQTPFAVIEARRKAGIKPGATSIQEMRTYLARIGYSGHDLDRLNIVHVAGTKGKGSTCAFVDSVLSRYHKAHGLPRRVGLFTSPHLVAVRERIRIDSAPISEELFARYFFDVWDRLAASPATDTDTDVVPPGSRPIYSRYLTLMSYHVFLSEGVDAAVYETGIGGEYDATNVVERPVASGISTLGIDHVYVLGDTVDKIAWHKAGIMKPGSPAFTIEQVPAAAKVLRDRAVEKSVDLKVLDIDPRLAPVKIRPDANFQKKNATLAIALAEAALSKLDPSFSPKPDSPLPQEFVDGLEQVVWRGRCEVKEEAGVAWHVDGAHTVDSLKMAARWFVEECVERRKPGPKVLIFNQQGRAEAVGFLDGLCNTVRGADPDGVGFKHVIFCTNVTYAQTGYKRDFVNHQINPKDIEKLTAQHAFAERWSALDPSANVMVVPSIEEAITKARNLAETLEDGEKVQALITGSLHLVGGALQILEGADAL
ncbi:tetrahydrofolylpolyglutamate synthase [Cercophora scortea]|uniref:Folylpolyglutamate synthase n=1 Tax=Cercophora scortea TaxID=314031 RepID=A0AAE0MJZ5_9PEZI|nr:tetrahydrofolylpolyglutamate synthase [Cercophora scortea]